MKRDDGKGQAKRPLGRTGGYSPLAPWILSLLAVAMSGVLAAGVSGPDIDVQGNGVSIVDGATSPVVANDTEFGNADVLTGTVTHTFTIENTGDADLTLTGAPLVAISGTHAGDFTVAAPPPPTTPVLAAASTTFDVTFDPSATGLRSATVTIANDDSDESSYTFDIQGTGTVAPEIDVQGNGVSIVDGAAPPVVGNDTEFGNADIVTDTVTHTFTIHNTGSALLTLGATAVTTAGAHAANFTVSAQPATTVAASGGTTTFDVTFDPSATGLRSATVTIANDDSDESSYTFDIQGTGTVAPEIDVQGNGVSIVDGAAPPVVANDTEFGDVNYITGAAVHTFTIRNTGSADLNLTGAPLVVIGGAHVGDFTVTAVPTTPVVAGGGPTTFQVTFDPIATGLRTATVIIANDDTDENPYDFAIQGTGEFVQPPGSGGASGPAASTSGASDVTQSAATLHGVVNPNNSSTTARFQYGAGNGGDIASAALNVVYTDTVPASENPVTGSVLTAVSAAIDGLTDNTTYHFRVVADNAEGTTYGLDTTFTTAVRFVGNVLNDGVLDLLDVRLCAQMAVGEVVGSAAQRARADVDGDGDVDMDDVILLSEYVLGIRTTLP